MEIRLEQLWSPECAVDWPCALCGETFTLGVVIARLFSRAGVDLGEVCPECALHLAAGPMGRARPEHFPGLEEFARRLDEWQGAGIRRRPGVLGGPRLQVGTGAGVSFGVCRPTTRREERDGPNGAHGGGR